MFNVHSDCTEAITLIKLQILEMNSNFRMKKKINCNDKINDKKWKIENKIIICLAQIASLSSHCTCQLYTDINS